MVKTNLKSIAECERALYSILRQFLKGEITPSQAKSFANVCNKWIAAKKIEDNERLLRKVEGLEQLFETYKKRRFG